MSSTYSAKRMPMEKLLSICIPTYNRIEKLKGLLGSIAKYPPKRWDMIEVCISDNCSTDGTREFLGQKTGEYPFEVKVGLNAKNEGMDNNILKALALGSGRYSWLVSDDDYFIENGLARAMNFLAGIKDEKTVLIYFSPRLRDNEGNFGLISEPNGFLSDIAVSKSAFEKIKKGDLKLGLKSGYMHCWIIRMLGFSDPENKAVYFGERLIDGEASNLRVELNKELRHSGSFITQYSWLFLHGKQRLFFAKKLVGAVGFPFFHILCERVFRNKGMEKLGIGFFLNNFGMIGIALWLYRAFIGILPLGASELQLGAALFLIGKAKLTKNAEYSFWQEYWLKNFERPELSNRSFFAE